MLRNKGHDIPTWPLLQQIPLPYAKQKLSGMLFAYAVYRFNKTHNIGSSIAKDVAVVRRVAYKYGIFISNDEFPWLGDLKRGINTIVYDHDNRKPNTKLGIFHPLLEKMLTLNNPYHNQTKSLEIFRLMLMQHRFVLRAQHIVKTTSTCDYLTLNTVKFLKDDNNTIYAITINTKKIKTTKILRLQNPGQYIVHVIRNIHVVHIGCIYYAKK
jgi:hypothetical protein